MKNPTYGYIIKKPNDNDIYWKSVDGEYNITSKIYDGGEIKNPILLSDGNMYEPSISFINKQSTGLFMKDPNVLGITCSGNNSLLISNYNMRSMNGTEKNPFYTFIDEENTGIYRDIIDGLSFSKGGHKRLSINDNDISIYSNFRINASNEPLSPIDNSYGYLYTKSLDGNLYWKSTNGEINLTDINSLINKSINEPISKIENILKSLTSTNQGFISYIDGTISKPAFSFLNSPDIGFYLYNKELCFTSNGVQTLKIDPNRILVNKEISFISDENTGIGKIFSNVNGTLLSSLAIKVQGKYNFIINNKEIAYEVVHKSIDGTRENPSYGFKKYNNVGMYCDNGNLVLETQNNKKIILQINNDKVVNIDNNSLTINENKLLLLPNNNSSNSLTTNLIPKNYTSIEVANGLNPVLASRDERSQLSKKYVCSDIFKSGCDHLNVGDVVGIMNDSTGHINKVNGGKWINTTKQQYKSVTNSVSSLWDSYDNVNDIHISTYENISGTSTNYKSTLNMKVEIFTKSENLILSHCEIVLNINDKSDNIPDIHSVRCVKINHKSNRYIICYGKYGDANNLTFKKFIVNYINNKVSVNVESTFTYNDNKRIETFDITYDSTYSLDILVLLIYYTSTNNMGAVLFKVYPDSTDIIQSGYSNDSILENPIIRKNKTCRVLTIPGNIVLCSYANTKTFLLLPSDHNIAYSIGDYTLDNESDDCVDIIYDTENGVIISIEKTISETSFLQIYDIFGTKIDVIKTKKLGNNTIIPIGLSYNPNTSYFTLFYSDNLHNGNIKVQIFHNDGESINTSLIFINNNVVYNSVMDNNKCILPNNGKLVYYRGNNRHSLLYKSGIDLYTTSIFNDNYGIQPSAFIGLTNNEAKLGGDCEVILKGQIYYNDNMLPTNYVGKKIYISGNSLDAKYPNNLTIVPLGNVFLGTVLTQNKILIGF